MKKLSIFNIVFLITLIVTSCGDNFLDKEPKEYGRP
jgi:hypothetical protein